MELGVMTVLPGNLSWVLSWIRGVAYNFQRFPLNMIRN